MRQDIFNNYYKQIPGFINKYKHSKDVKMEFLDQKKFTECE